MPSIGPNIKRLIAYKMSMDAIPKGGGIADGVSFLTNPERFRKSAKDAIEFISTAILAIKQAPEPNPFKNSSDEEIAAEILSRIEKVRA